MFMCWAMSCLVHSTVLAATPPNAGSLQQQMQSGRDLHPPTPPQTSSMPAAQRKPTAKAGTLVVVSQFNWVGNSLYNNEVLNRLTNDLLNRPLAFAELEAAAVTVATHYRSAGYVVLTRLPTQDIVNGVVTIEIMEASFGKVVMDGPSSKRVDAARIEETIYAVQPSGTKLNAHNIDRALAILSDLAGIRVQGRLLPSTASGLTDFVVSTQDAPSSVFDTSLDNAGARSTGQNRATFGWTLNSPLGWGDQFNANVMSSRGSDFVRAAYQWPVGLTGWTLQAHASRMNYSAPLASESAGLVSRLHLTGRADAYGLETSYPLSTRHRFKLQSGMGLDLKNYINQRDASMVSSYQTRTFNLGLKGQTADSWAGGGLSSWQLSRTNGILQSKIDTDSNLLAGRYAKLKYAFNRFQEINQHWSWHVALNGQSSKTLLDASENFYLGGMNGVRAYPSSEGGGSGGQLLNLELRHQSSGNVTWFAFYDHGQVLVNPSGSDVLNRYALKGHGVGWSHTGAKGLNVKAMVARRLGHNPNPTATGQDQDGSLVLNRFWLSASLPF